MKESSKAEGMKKQEGPTWPEVLKAWRARRGITQKQAAEELGVGMRTYQKWENGERKTSHLPPDNIFKLLCE
jgi:transcriptional regulator with XRE-family HTH domain